MQILMIDVEKDNNINKLVDELKEENDTYITFLDDKEKDIEVVKEFDVAIVKANSLEDVQKVISKKNLKEIPLILMTDNLDEKFIWNSSPYFVDIISNIKSSDWLMKRLYSVVYQYA